MAIKINGTTVINDSRSIVNTVDAIFTGTTAIKLPAGTTAQRPTPTAGMLRYNTDKLNVEYHNGTNWYPTSTTGITGAMYYIAASVTS